MPRLWADTMETHRRQVHDAILDATAELIAEQGPLSVAMSAIAERAGIGRATLYKYFPDVESILVAWHARDFAHHLDRLQGMAGSDDVSLNDVVHFVSALRGHHLRSRRADLLGSLAQSLAMAEGVSGQAVYREVIGALTAVVTRLARHGEVRTDYAPELLAEWLFHAAHAPGHLDDRAVARLLADSLGLRSDQKQPRRSG